MGTGTDHSPESSRSTGGSVRAAQAACWRGPVISMVSRSCVAVMLTDFLDAIRPKPGPRVTRAPPGQPRDVPHPTAAPTSAPNP
jgi:hypothetical protein